jgi:hypothetical protein
LTTESLKLAREWLDKTRAKEALAMSDWIGEAEAYCKHLPDLLALFADIVARDCAEVAYAGGSGARAADAIRRKYGVSE